MACAAQRYSRYAVTGAGQRGARQGCGRLHAVGQACLVGDSFTGIRSALRGADMQTHAWKAGSCARAWWWQGAPFVQGVLGFAGPE